MSDRDSQKVDREFEIALDPDVAVRVCRGKILGTTITAVLEITGVRYLVKGFKVVAGLRKNARVTNRLMTGLAGSHCRIAKRAAARAARGVLVGALPGELL